MGLLDALQDERFRKDIAQGLLDAGNHGITSGLLGLPVDMATMAMRPFGYQHPSPVGGAAWLDQKMQDAGIVSGNRNTLAELIATMAAPGGAQRLGSKLLDAEAKAAKLLKR